MLNKIRNVLIATPSAGVLIATPSVAHFGQVFLFLLYIKAEKIFLFKNM